MKKVLAMLTTIPFVAQTSATSDGETTNMRNKITPSPQKMKTNLQITAANYTT